MSAVEIELGVYETFEDLFGKRATLDELVTEITRFSLQSVIWVCAHVVTVMQLWDRNDPPLDAYRGLLRWCFPRQLATRFLAGHMSSNPKREVFHRRQILLITKLAIEHCNSYGLDLRYEGHKFGSILLKTNDQFHFGLLGGDVNLASSKDDFAHIIAEFSAVTEYSSPNVQYQIVRNHLLLTKFTQMLSHTSDYVDAALEFQASSGFSLKELEALLFITHARYSRDLAAEVQIHSGSLPLRESHYSQTAISEETLRKFFRRVAGTSSLMRDDIKKRSFGSNDLTVFRQYPLIEQWYNTGTFQQSLGYQLMDNHFLLEKQLAGPYFLALEKYGERFTRFWGSVFERYVDELLHRACEETSARFVPDVRHPKNPDKQVCDGVVIEGDRVVILEYKASIFSAAAKYSGDPVRLAAEIDKKLVSEQRGGKTTKKAVLQLADAAKEFLRDPSIAESLGLDLSKVRTIYPLLLTLDGIGGTVGISPYLDLAFQSAIQEIGSAPQLSALRCIDAEALEYMADFFHSQSLPKLLALWGQVNPSGTVPFVGVAVNAKRIANSWLLAEYDEMFKSMVSILFPRRDPVESLQGAKAQMKGQR